MMEQDGMILAARLGLEAQPVAIRDPDSRGWIIYSDTTLEDGSVIACYWLSWPDGRNLITDEGNVLWEYSSIGLDLTPQVMEAVQMLIEPYGFRLVNGAIRRDSIDNPEQALREFMALAPAFTQLERNLLDARKNK